MSSDHDEVDYDEEEDTHTHTHQHPQQKQPPAAEMEEDIHTHTQVKTKGRGHTHTHTQAHEGAHRGGHYESIDNEEGRGGAGDPAKSIEGWVICVTGVHEEAQEDEIVDKFSEFGDVKNIQMNLDRRTGFVKGYAFIEFGTKKEAEEAIKEMDGESLYEKEVKVDWAFIKGGR